MHSRRQRSVRATGTSVDRTLKTQEFGEAGIDLTAAGVIPANTCASFGKAYAVSRSSGQSSQAQMKDLVGPAHFNLTNCGSDQDHQAAPTRVGWIRTSASRRTSRARS